MKIHEQLTVGISSKNNIAGVCLCVSSVLCGTELPGAIMLRLEGDLPDFDNYNLAQLVALARLKGVGFELHYCNSYGIHATREWQVNHCRTKYLHFLDDDVILDCRAIEFFMGYNEMQTPWIYLQGVKADINNRRGYKDFSLSWNTVVTGEHYNWLYADTVPNEAHPCRLADMGNIVVNLQQFKEHNMSFLPFERHTFAGGEDTLFGLMCEKRDLKRFWLPRAIAFHLEKNFVRLSEHSYRKALLLREAQILDLNFTLLDQVLPWEPVMDSKPHKQ